MRPTELNFVPRIWEMLFQRVPERSRPAAVRRRRPRGAKPRCWPSMRQNLLGGRSIFAMTGSAPISPELKAWVEALLDMHLIDGYGSTEAGMVLGRRRGPASAGASTTSWSTFPTWATSPPTGRIRAASCWSRPRTCSPATTSAPRSPPTCSTPTATTAPATSSPRSVPTSWCTSTAATTC